MIKQFSVSMELLTFLLFLPDFMVLWSYSGFIQLS